MNFQNCLKLYHFYFVGTGRAITDLETRDMGLSINSDELHTDHCLIPLPQSFIEIFAQ